MSIKNVQAPEFAAIYNDLTNQISDRVLTEGRYVLNPATRLLRFPRTLETIDMTGAAVLQCLTSDGLQMQLDLSVQFALIRESIQTVVKEFGAVSYTHLTLPTTPYV